MSYCDRYAELEEFRDSLRYLEPPSEYYKNIIEDMVTEVEMELNELEPRANAEYREEIRERNREYEGGLF